MAELTIVFRLRFAVAIAAALCLLLMAGTLSARAASPHTGEYIVQMKKGTTPAAGKRLVRVFGGRVTSPTLRVINGFGAKLSRRAAARLRHAKGVRAVSLNTGMSASATDTSASMRRIRRSERRGADGRRRRRPGRALPAKGCGLDQIDGRMIDVGIYFFGQKKVAEEGPQHRTSKHHLFIFWGFLIITVATADTIVSSAIHGLSLALLPDIIYQPIYVVIDCFNLIVLVMIIWAFIRRILVKPALIPMTLDAGLILGGIGSLMVTHFLMHAYEIAGDVTLGHAAPWWLPGGHRSTP